MNTSTGTPAMTDQRKMRRLGELKRGEKAKILSVNGSDRALVQRMMEMGLLEGCTVELVHEAPFGGDPIAIRVRGALIALRRNEANLIEVES